MRNNKGFSLIELLVTIAISSVVLLMISYMLVQGTTLFKDENEDIDIQNEAQIVRNQITEALMSAKSVIVVDAGDDLVIYTGSVDETDNRLEAEKSGSGGASEVTTERIITYKKEDGTLYISSTLSSATSEGNMLSNYVTGMSISFNEDCKRTTGEEGTESYEEYYVNPLSVDIEIQLAHGKQETDISMSIKNRNILREVAIYKTGSLAVLLENATSKSVYRVK